MHDPVRIGREVQVEEGEREGGREGPSNFYAAIIVASRRQSSKFIQKVGKLSRITTLNSILNWYKFPHAVIDLAPNLWGFCRILFGEKEASIVSQSRTRDTEENEMRGKMKKTSTASRRLLGNYYFFLFGYPDNYQQVISMRV